MQTPDDYAANYIHLYISSAKLRVISMTFADIREISRNPSPIDKQINIKLFRDILSVFTF